MAEGTLPLSMLVRAFRFELAADQTPMPVAQLTLRAKDGIHLKLTPRIQQNMTERMLMALQFLKINRCGRGLI